MERKRQKSVKKMNKLEARNIGVTKNNEIISTEAVANVYGAGFKTLSEFTAGHFGESKKRRETTWHLAAIYEQYKTVKCTQKSN